MSQTNANHLIESLHSAYIIIIGKIRGRSCGWADISILKYVIRVLTKLEHPATIKSKHTTHKWVTTVFRQQVHIGS